MPAAKIDGTMARQMRLSARLNQQQFWGRLGVTQSGGSRYESGRAIPKPVRKLLLAAIERVGTDALLRDLNAVRPRGRARTTAVSWAK